MKLVHSSRSSSLFGILTIGLLFLDLCATAAERSWTDVTGRKIQAEYIASDATSVTLSIAGKHHQLPLTRLSAADQAWIVEQKSSPAPAVATAFPAMTQRQIFEFFFNDRAASKPRMSVMAGKEFLRVSDPSKLPAGDFYVHGIFEAAKSPQPFPWALLQQMPKLMDLSVKSSTPITAADLAHLSVLTQPYSLMIDCDFTLDTAAVAALPRQLTHKYLVISTNLVAEKDLPSFAKHFPKLEMLFAKRADSEAPALLTDQALAAALPAWSDLKDLALEGTRFTAATAKAIQSSRKLEKLTLTSSEGITLADLTALADHRSLKTLKLQKIPQITDKDVQTLQAALKDCKVDHEP
ncbi:MAG: hypothetical protein IPK22_09980 [Verrucomicrobiaceae bacterium]|nr:hypothetical protein [Verrucomicrobiaceae bacterium]